MGVLRWVLALTWTDKVVSFVFLNSVYRTNNLKVTTYNVLLVVPQGHLPTLLTLSCQENGHSLVSKR